MHRFPLAAFLLAVLLLNACALRGGGGGTQAALDGSWMLVEGMQAGSPLSLAGRSVTLEIDGTKVRGNSGCNIYGGTLIRDGDTVRFDALSMTEMGCPDGAMNLESAYVAALADVRRVEATEPQLILAGSSSRLVFEPQQPVADAALVGTSWRLETLVDGDTASSTVGGADPATLVLDPTGSFQASTGCRTVTGTYALDGTRLRLTLNPYDAFGCTDPIGTQDAFVLGFLDGAYDATVSGRQLTLGSGERQLVYTAA